MGIRMAIPGNLKFRARRIVLLAMVACGAVFAQDKTSSALSKENLEGLENVQSLTKDSNQNKKINVKDFGAKGDGVADDTAAIQKALNEARRNTTVYFPAGVYNISSTLTVSAGNGNRLTGDGSSTVLIARKPMKHLLHIRKNAIRFLMDFMTVDGNGNAENTIRLDGGYYVVFNSIYVTNPLDIGLSVGSLDEYAGNELFVTDSYFTGMRQIDNEAVYSKTGIKVQRFSDCIIHGGFVRGFVECGIDLDAPDLLVSHMHVYKLPAIRTKVGIRTRRHGSALVNNQIDNMTDAYIESLGTVSVISGNLFVRTSAVFGHEKYTDIRKTPGVLLGNNQYAAKGVVISGNSYYSNRNQVEYNGERGVVDGDTAGLITAVAANCEDVICVDNAYGDLNDRIETRASGTAVIPIGQSSVFVPATMLGKITQVQLTPQSSVSQFWNVGQISEKGFEIQLAGKTSSPATFCWNAQSACVATSKIGSDYVEFH
jgi:hypothetical protein